MWTLYEKRDEEFLVELTAMDPSRLNGKTYKTWK